jgi:hypothetical protein
MILANTLGNATLGSIALAVFVLCVAFVMLRGLTRMILSTVVLALSAGAAFYVWQLAPGLSTQWTGISQPLITNGLPAGAFVCAFIIIRKMLHSITHPLGIGKENSAPSSLLRTVTHLIFALVPTSLISTIGAVFIHHQGSLAEVRNSGEPAKKSAAPDLTQQLKSALESSLPASWLTALDPLTQRPRIALAKLITARAADPHKALIDPTTGKPIPRAILITEDPELQKLARSGNFESLMRHPLLTKALADPAVQKLIKDLHL